MIVQQERTDYDVWQCARCGTYRRTRSVPHEQALCCGTGMWWIRFEQGTPYLVDREVAK